MADRIVLIFSILAVAALVYLFIAARRKPVKPFPPLQEDDLAILRQFVWFYNELDAAKQKEFEKRVQSFLSSIKITGVKTTVERIDELFIGASAIIPVFSYPEWEYMHLSEVLLYPRSFNARFKQTGDDATRAGIVGDGPYQNVMILSKPDLRAGFMAPETRSNTGIHEFVHLIDKTDGAVDGVPGALLAEEYIDQWISMARDTIIHMREYGSDIDMYGATNRVEFFAVISEYFFKQPAMLSHYHPDVYRMLTRIYKYRNEG